MSVQLLDMPIVLEPNVVVSTDQVHIEEFAGNASIGGGDISVAKVSAKKGFEEDWQCPEFDEYVVVLKGSIVIGTNRDIYT